MCSVPRYTGVDRGRGEVTIGTKSCEYEVVSDTTTIDIAMSLIERFNTVAR